MSLIDDIKRDREAGTRGPWFPDAGKGPEIHGNKATVGVWAQHLFDRAIDDPSVEEPEDEKWVLGVWGLAGDVDHANARRCARVPDLEAALLAAEELAEKLGEALFILECDDPERPIVSEAKAALTAYREALK